MYRPDAMSALGADLVPDVVSLITKGRPMRLADIPAGKRFQRSGRAGVVLNQSDFGTRVRYDGDSIVDIEEDDTTGRKAVSFTRPQKAVTISSETEVEPIDQ